MAHYYELVRDEAPHTLASTSINNQFFAHFHAAIEVMYVESGEICVFQNGVSTLVGAGFLIVNSSYMLHSYDTPVASKVIVCTIPLSRVPSLRASLLQNSFAQGVVDVRNMKECRRIMRMMAEPANKANPSFVDLLGEALLAYLIDKIGLVETTGDTQSDLMKNILLYLQEHATEDITVSQTAAHFGYSTGRFSHIFNERVGCPFIRYVNSLRCQKAQQLLAEGEQSLIEVANACGFNSLRTFHRVYKDFTGETPRSAQAR